MADIRKRKRKRRPGKTKPRDSAVGVLSLAVAKVAKRRIYYILNLFWGADQRRLRGFPYLLRLDASRVPAAQLRALEAGVRAQLASEAAIEEAIAGFADIVAALRASGAVSAVPVSQGDAGRILGAFKLRGDRLATLSDAGESMAGSAGLIIAGTTAIQQAAASPTMQLSSALFATDASAFGIGAGTAASAGGALLLAGTGGVLIGHGVDREASAFLQWKTNGELGSLGAWLATTEPGRAISSWLNGTDSGTGAVADGEAPPAPSTPTPAPPSPPATPPSTPAADKSDDDDGDNDANESGETTGDDDDDSNGSGETTGDGEAGGEGTTLPPDLDHGTSFGNILLHASTGLLANEVRAQLRALDIFAGGALGAGGERDTFAANVVLDQLIGTGFLKGVERNLSTLRNSRGLRPAQFVGGAIDATRLRNFGLVGGPRPLDINLKGKAARALRRR